MPFDAASLALYPTNPGVYLMKDATGSILYIGKANNLRKRLKQYFSSRKEERFTIARALSQLDAIECIVTLTEKDALILENNLIKLHQPKYNILLKDDKTFISLLITQHLWPMFRLVRVKKEPHEEGRYFGPYATAFSARKTFDLVSRLFPLRQCSDAELTQRKRPCMLFDLKRCVAPCAQKCTQEEYQQLVLSAEQFLRGEHEHVLNTLNKEMDLASERMEYERAAVFLRMIRQIQHVDAAQHVEHFDMEDCDAVGFFRKEATVEFSLLQFREGRLLGSEHFSFQEIAGSDPEILSLFLFQHYRLIHKPPPTLLLPFACETQQGLEEVLWESQHKKITLEIPKKGKKKDLVEMATKNAEQQFKRAHDEHALDEKKLLDLQEVLQLTRFPRRIECIDTSHLFGANSVAAIASFSYGRRDKSRTRFFRIKSKEKAEDIHAMKEALHRHLLREKKSGELCDLLILDGGKAQLTLAQDVFRELEIASVDLIALTKEAGRHDKGLSQEHIYTPFRPTPLILDVRSPLLFLLQRIRDETHRLAIEYHRKRTRTKMTESALDAIPGIGPAKKKLLLTHFGSIRALKNAPKESLEAIKGLSRSDKKRLASWIECSITEKSS